MQFSFSWAYKSPHEKDNPIIVMKCWICNTYSLLLIAFKRTDSLRCGEATAVETVHRTVSKSRLSNPMSSPTTKKTSSYELVFFVVGEDGFEPSKRNAADLQSVPFGHSGTPPDVQLCVPTNFDIIA